MSLGCTSVTKSVKKVKTKGWQVGGDDSNFEGEASSKWSSSKLSQTRLINIFAHIATYFELELSLGNLFAIYSQSSYC